MDRSSWHINNVSCPYILFVKQAVQCHILNGLRDLCPDSGGFEAVDNASSRFCCKNVPKLRFPQFPIFIPGSVTVSGMNLYRELGISIDEFCQQGETLTKNSKSLFSK